MQLFGEIAKKSTGNNNIKKKMPHETIRTVPKSNRKIVESESNLISLTHIHMCTQSLSVSTVFDEIWPC